MYLLIYAYMHILIFKNPFTLHCKHLALHFLWCTYSFLCFLCFLQAYIDTYLYKIFFKNFAPYSLLFLFYSCGNVFIWNTKITEQLFKS